MSGTAPARARGEMPRGRQRSIPRRVLTVCGGAAVVLAACAGDGTGEADGADATPPSPVTDSIEPADDLRAPDTEAPAPTGADPDAGPASTEPATTEPAETTTTIDPTEARTAEQINDYIAEAAAFDQVGADSQFPQGLTFSAGGAPGYSRYVFREHREGVVPTLVEGPISDAVRCQDADLPCSYLELKALHDSGLEVPAELGMNRAELGDLVAQLDQVNAFAELHRDVDTACADGFVSDRIQTANMGSHFYRPDWIGDGFDPARPEILLYALADDTQAEGPVGQCVDGVWQGEPMQLVGASFLIPPSVIGNEHPETFAGPLDNWHIHYNLCRGSAQGRDTFVPRSDCEASGGSFSEALGWMLHAWIDPQHDNQLGVFSMWNDTIAPTMDATTILETREVRGSDFPAGAEQSLITDFLYTGDLRVKTGQPLFFNNVDAVPHTVSAGTPEDPALDEFDSGLLTPGSNYELTLEEPGVYSLFCSLHPDMVATVTVED